MRLRHPLHSWLVRLLLTAMLFASTQAAVMASPGNHCDMIGGTADVHTMIQVDPVFGTALLIDTATADDCNDNDCSCSHACLNRVYHAPLLSTRPPLAVRPALSASLFDADVPPRPPQHHS